MMTVCGIAASPRRHCNTETLLDAALDAAAASGAATEKIVLNELAIRPCQACGGCDRTGRCVIRDGMDTVYDVLLRADGLIIASPLYFASVTAQLKAMIDRCHCVWVRHFSLGQASGKTLRAGFICAAGSPSDHLLEHARKVVRVFCKSIGAEYCREVWCGDAEARDAAASRNAVLDEARRLGAFLVKGA